MHESYSISEIHLDDTRRLAEVDALLSQEGINRDAHLDYICGILDETGQIIATGSCFDHTLRCFAVSREHQGEGLLSDLLSHLIAIQFQRGHTHLFLYTKPKSAHFFSDLGFYEIARVPGMLVFMENRRNGFSEYLKGLTDGLEDIEASAAVVMNANPFTLGHQYLVESAASRCKALHLFVLSEDASLVPFSVRKKLVEEGCAHLSNVIVHDSGPYLISHATFPSYFLKEETAVIQGHAFLDLAVFARIASALHITERYVGDEPTSLVTGIYNRIMAEELPRYGIDCHILPRKKAGNSAISASVARLCLQSGDWNRFRTLVPDSTYHYFISPEARPVIQKIQNAEQVIHY